MWNCDGSWIGMDLERPEILGYDTSSGSFESVARCDILDALTYTIPMIATKEATTQMNDYENALKKARDVFTRSMRKPHVDAFCSVKSIEVSVDHRTVVVVWTDGDKTMVKRSAKDPDDLYMAFTAALAKKVYGSNSAIKRLINKKGNEHKPKEKKETVRVVRKKKEVSE